MPRVTSAHGQAAHDITRGLDRPDFSAKAVAAGGVVRRNRAWVEAEVGLQRFEDAVRARGYHLIEAGQQLVVICHSGPVRLRF